MITDLQQQLFFQLLFIGAGYWFYLKKSVSASGFVFLLLTTGSLIWTSNNETITAIVMMFLFSTWATRYKEADKKPVHKRLAESGPRNWKQGFANLGPACLLALGAFFSGEIAFVHAAFASIAAATADTFASEIGVLSKKQPCFILSRKKVPPGISGGVTLLGMSASAGGASLIALTHVCFFKDPLVATMIVGLGILGSIIDSVIGELYQVLYVNRTGDWVETSGGAEELKGVRWMTNNVVNMITTVTIGIVSYFLAAFCL
ncbi:MAG: DUF92 domain-containing protein [Ferruginibacter sp.]